MEITPDKCVILVITTAGNNLSAPGIPISLAWKHRCYSAKDW